MASILKGIDVSIYQKVINWNSVKRSGCDFAILKVISKTLEQDKYFDRNYSECLKYNIEVGVYNYSYATTMDKFITDANRVVEVLKNNNVKNITVWLDVEDKCQKNLGELLIKGILEYKKIVESNGYTFGVYTGLGFYNSYIKKYASRLSDIPFWIARYYKKYTPMNFSETPNKDYVPKIANKLYGWQYTSSGIISGIEGSVDFNITYLEESTTNVKKTTSNIVTANSLNVRNKPSTKSDIVGCLMYGETINILSVVDGWYEIAKNKWVSAKYIKTKVGMVTTSSLSIRSGNSTKYIVMGYLKLGAKVNIFEEKDGWYRCDKGWISSKYVTIE